MNYIIFDLEWNQGKLGKKDRHHASIPFEIIEIGAVKLDENRNVTGQFHELIRPRIYKDMPQLIEQMLHVNMEELADGNSFEEVCEAFLDWCGEDPVFCTWGNQDLTELQRNMLYFGIGPLSDGPFEYLDIQKLFSIAFEDGKTRRNLKYAIDFLKIDKDAQFHRAYADAYYTAQVFLRIDRDLEQYCSYDVFWLPQDKDAEIHKIFPDYSKYISRKFASRAEAMADKEVTSMRCYICSSPARRRIRWFSPGGRYCIGVSQCPRHGYIKGKVRFRKHVLSESESEAVYIDKTQKLIDENEMKVIAEKYEKAQEAYKNRKKRLTALLLCLSLLQPALLNTGGLSVYAEPAAQTQQTADSDTEETETAREQAFEATVRSGDEPAETEDEGEEGSEETDEYTDEQSAQKSEEIQTNEIVRWPQGPAVSAEGAILIEADTGTVLYGKNIHEKLYPASTTKILTTLIASEQSDLTEMVKFSPRAVNSIERASSNMGIDIGQELTMEQCLYGILVYSANEVANAVAEHVSGSIEDFVDLMNQRALELGCTDSHFVTTNGLHDDNHYTTPYDLAMIGRAFFANETLAGISGTNYYHIPPTSKQPDDIELYTHNQLTRGQYTYEGYVGGKTGFTTVARQTLVTCAERGGMRLICVVMREESPNQYLDTMALFDYGFQNFDRVSVAENETRYTIHEAEFLESSFMENSQTLMEIDPADTIVMPNTLSFDELNAFMSDVSDENRPNRIAQIEYTYENIPLGSAGVILSEDTCGYDFYAAGNDASEEKVIYVNLKKVLLIFAGVFVGLLLIIHLIAYFKDYHFSRRSSGTGQNLNFRKRERRQKKPKWQRIQERKQIKINKSNMRNRYNKTTTVKPRSRWKRN